MYQCRGAGYGISERSNYEKERRKIFKIVGHLRKSEIVREHEGWIIKKWEKRRGFEIKDVETDWKIMVPQELCGVKLVSRL